MHSLSSSARRYLLGRRHLLRTPRSVTGGDGPEQVADDLVVLHATDPATVYLSVAARLDGATVDAVDAALFERSTMHRTLAMRRTLFVGTVAMVALAEASSSIDVAASERKVLEKALTGAGVAEPARWIQEAAEEIKLALSDGALPARSLTKTVPRLATKVVLGSGRHTIETGATSRTLGVLAAEGMLLRGRPRGGWTDRQYQWQWRERAPLPDPDQAASDILDRWLARFGPGTLTDLKWWTGWTVTKTRKALAGLDVVEVDLEGRTGYVRAGDLEEMLDVADREPDHRGSPWIALLPALDPTPMGWKDRAWYVGDHAAELFDRNGNIGPTIWADGRIVGAWSQTPSGEIALGLLEEVGRDRLAMIDAEAERLAAFIGQTRFKPSFPTPLQKRLADSGR